MATAAPMSRQPQPNEEDLQHLYNEVWAGFIDEPSSAVTQTDTSVGDLDSFYGAYGSDDNPSKLSSRRPSANPCAWSIICCNLSVIDSKLQLNQQGGQHEKDLYRNLRNHPHERDYGHSHLRLEFCLGLRKPRTLSMIRKPRFSYFLPPFTN